MDSQSVDLLLNSKTHSRLASSLKLEDCVKDFFGSEAPGEGPGKGTKRKQKQTLTSASEGTGCRGCENLSKKLALKTTELEVAALRAATSIGQLRKELAAAKKTPKVSAESKAPEMSEKLRAANSKIATLNNKLARLDEIAETRGTQGCVSCGDLKKELEKTKVTMGAFL